MSLLKTTHASSKAAQSAKLRRLGAVGNLKMARKGENAPRKYASGGAVDSGPVDGAPAKPRLDRPGRKMAGKGKGAKGTNVNVVIMQKPDGGGAGPKPDMPMPGPPPGAGPGGPPMPPPPMKAYGGAVGRYASGGRIANLGKYAHGGKVKRADGGWTGEGDSGKKLREDANDLDKGAKAKSSSGMSKAALGAAGTGYFRLGRTASGMGDRAAKVGSIGLLADGVKDIFGGLKDSTTARRKTEEADKAEGRKRGGSVRQASDSDDEGAKLPAQKRFGRFNKGGKC